MEKSKIQEEGVMGVMRNRRLEGQGGSWMDYRCDGIKIPMTWFYSNSQEDLLNIDNGVL